MNTDDWKGSPDRDCAEHRTTGSLRAWCFDCSEWCYADGPACQGCADGMDRADEVGGLLDRIFAEDVDLLKRLQDTQPIEYTFWGAVRECLEMTKGTRLRHRAHVIWIQVGRPRAATRRKFSWCECCCEICDPDFD